MTDKKSLFSSSSSSNYNKKKGNNSHNKIFLENSLLKRNFSHLKINTNKNNDIKNLKLLYNSSSKKESEFQQLSLRTLKRSITTKKQMIKKISIDSYNNNSSSRNSIKSNIIFSNNNHNSRNKFLNLIKYNSLNNINVIERKKIKNNANEFYNEFKTITNFPNFNKENLTVKKLVNHNQLKPNNLCLSAKKLNIKYIDERTTLYDIIPNKVKFSIEKMKKVKNIFNEQPGVKMSKKKIRKVFSCQTLIVKPSTKISKKYNIYKKLLLSKGKLIQNELKYNIKLEIIRDIWETNSLLIEKLIISYNKFKWFFKENIEIKRNKFKEFCNLAKFNIDDELIDTFYVILEKKNNTLDINILLIIFILTNKYNFEYKINKIIEILQNYQNNIINIKYFENIFNKIFINKAYKIIINKFCSNLIFNYRLFNKNYLIDSHDLYDEIVKFEKFKKIFEHFYEYFKKSNIKLNYQIQNLLNSHINHIQLTYNSGIKEYDKYKYNKFENLILLDKEYHTKLLKLKQLGLNDD